MCWKVPEQFRVKYPPYHPYFAKEGEPFGSFEVPSPDESRVTRTLLFIIASPGMDGIEWEHVSVHAYKRLGKTIKLLTPTWAEMCFVKSLFWDDEDCVVQYHPPKSEYVNIHEHTLHLYRPTVTEIPRPPRITV